MSVKDSIFGSKGEERGFRSIEHTWGEKYRLYPQFPWSALFTPDPRWRDTSNLFFKTSVDYVLSTVEGQPLLAIDFDGMGDGFDRNGEYVPVRLTPDRHRKAKFDFKLRYARENNFPYHIVASREFCQLGDGIDLTVVDAIIGSIIARKYFWEQAQFLIDEHVAEIANQPRWYQSEYANHLLIDLETECEVEHDPIVQKTFEVWNQITAITGEEVLYSHSNRHFAEPELPTDFESRLEAMKKVVAWGCVTTLFGTPVGEVSDVATVRANTCAVSISNIAELMAYSKLLRLLRRKA